MFIGSMDEPLNDKISSNLRQNLTGDHENLSVNIDDNAFNIIANVLVEINEQNFS